MDIHRVAYHSSQNQYSTKDVVKMACISFLWTLLIRDSQNLSWDPLAVLDRFMDFTDKRLFRTIVRRFGSLGLNTLQTPENTGLGGCRSRSIPPTISPKTTFPVSIMRRYGSFPLHNPHKMGFTYPVPVPSFQHPGTFPFCPSSYPHFFANNETL